MPDGEPPDTIDRDALRRMLSAGEPVTVLDVSKPDALALLDELEAGKMGGLKALIEATGESPDALARLQQVYADAPALANRIGGLLFQVEHKLLSRYPDGYRETLQHQAREMRTSLNGESGSELETVLVGRLVLDWMASLLADQDRALLPGESRNLELSRFYDQQADRAQKRFLRSAESLARVRRLLQPIAQVNIAEQQVNVAGNVTSPNRSDGEAR